MGIHFIRELKTKKSTNQNSGVRMCIVNSNGEKNNYYGVIEEIWELKYGPIVVPLFHCEWVAGGGVTKDRFGMTIVDFKKIGYKDESFVLANLFKVNYGHPIPVLRYASSSHPFATK